MLYVLDLFVSNCCWFCDSRKANNETGGDDTEAKEEVEDGPKEMTLAEYKKLEEEKRKLPKFNLRKPGEGEDNAQWKKTFLLPKTKEEEEVEYEEIIVVRRFLLERGSFFSLPQN